MFDMLWFAYKHHKAINKFMGDQRNNLRKFELKENDWIMVKQLCNILEVYFAIHGMLSHC